MNGRKQKEPQSITLREAIISLMKAFEEKQASYWGDRYHRDRDARYCTWWFTRKLMISNPDIRRELKRMERDGLVVADRSQPNNTKWILTAAAIGEGMK